MIEKYTTEIKLNSQNILSRAKKGFWSIIDQGLFSGANFLVNILLARWLSPKEYGAFAVALSIFYLIAGFHTAVLTEPMMVFGAGKYRDHFRKYIGILIYMHCGISMFIVSGLIGTSWLFLRRGSQFGMALLGLAVASPFLLLLWFTRRACYANLRPIWAMEGSLIYFIVVLAGLFLIKQSGVLSSFTGLLLLGASAGMVSIVLLVRHLRPCVWSFSYNLTPYMMVRDHWGYGSWNILGVVAYWGASQILNLLIPIFLGISASAILAAVWNLYRPVSLFMQSLGLILLPVFSRWVKNGMDPHQLRNRVIDLVLIFSGAVGLYGLVLSIGAKTILHLLYAGKYDKHWLLVVFFGLSTVTSTTIGIFILILKAYGQTDVAAKIWILSAVLVSLISIPMMKVAGLEGAIISVVVAYIIACWRAYAQLSKKLKIEKGRKLING